MYFSKDADSVPPPSNHPGSTGAGPRHIYIHIDCCYELVQSKDCLSSVSGVIGSENGSKHLEAVLGCCWIHATSHTSPPHFPTLSCPDVYIKIPRTCDYVTWRGIKDFTDVIKPRMLRWLKDNLRNCLDELNIITNIVTSERGKQDSQNQRRRDDKGIGVMQLEKDRPVITG